MTPTAAGQSRLRNRAAALAMRSRLAALAMLLGIAASSVFAIPSQAQPVNGEATLAASGGFARLVVKLDDDVESEVVVAGSVLVIRFKRPVAVAVEKLSDAAPDYVGSVRRDPDGSAIRLALARKVTVNTMTAGERLFVDLLPDNWVGAPPPLPAEVVRELSERARAAERLLRQRQLATDAQKRPPIRVRASVQPTFVRFVFELPDSSGVSSTLNEQKLTLLFNAAYSFDLAEAKIAAPSNIASINQGIEGDASRVEVALIGNVDVHSFREEKNYIVDIGFQQAEKSTLLTKPPSPPPPAQRPANPASDPASEPRALQKSGMIAPQPAQASRDAVAPVAAAVAKPESVPAPKETVLPIARPEAAPAAAVAVDARRRNEGLHLSFAFDAPTPAALFRRADVMWLVVDTAKPIDAEAILREGAPTVADVSVTALPAGQAIRIRLNRPQLASVSGDERNLVLTFADTMQSPPTSLSAMRNVADAARASVTVPLSGSGVVHRLQDPDAGDALIVVTASLPARGFIRRQDFVEFSLLESVHGVVVQPNSDDVIANTASDKIVVSRPGGLTISAADAAPDRASAAVRPVFDAAEWRNNQQEKFGARRDTLQSAAAQATGDQKLAARLDLARFYMAHGFHAEARGVLDLALSEQKAGFEDPATLIVHAVASTLIGQPEQSLKDLASPAIGANFDSQLWKALAYARQEKWADAREKFKNVEFAITSLPLELQRVAIADAFRSSLEVKDYSGAATRSNDMDIVGITPEFAPSIAILRGRLAEALGRDKDALREYQSAASSADRRAAIEGKLLEIALRQKREEIAEDDALRDLETMAMMWRGDALEVKTLQTMSKIYASRGRYNEAFAAARAATRLQPNSEVARKIQDDVAALFTQLYLGPKGDDLPPVEALAMFYEYRELTPIGRKGDEMIRRLADRLVSVDLLDQAGELFQYQIDHRLEGAARAQVASRLAMVYLMNRKPDRAVATIRGTRITDLAGELRQQRLLLEARAQSDIGRHDLALDIVASSAGREAVRLRSDIYWAARRWRESSEQIELYYGERWRNFQPLTAIEKGDVIRAAIGYALADDQLGLTRFREKYLPKMSGETDRTAFELASKPATASSAEYAQIAKMAATVDTLDGFLREMKTRFPDAVARTTLPPETTKPDPFPTGALPEIVGLKRIEAKR